MEKEKRPEARLKFLRTGCICFWDPASHDSGLGRVSSTGLPFARKPHQLQTVCLASHKNKSGLEQGPEPGLEPMKTLFVPFSQRRPRLEPVCL